MKTFPLPRVFLVFPLLLVSALSWAADDVLAGKVVYLDGSVTSNGVEADIGDVLVGPVTLKTGRASELEVIFGGKNVFRLGPNTTVRVDFSEIRKTVTLESGAFTSVLKKLGQSAGAAFVLRTPTMNAGVRGTSFHVTTDGTRTYFCTCNGSVALADPTGAQEVVLTNAHHGSRIFTKGEDGAVTVASGGLEDHTDASLETLAQRIVVGIDWTQPDLKHD
jgi:hypothetical protein